MKLRGVALALLLCLLATQVSAHTLNLVATFSWKTPGTLTVKLSDVYGSPISGVPVTVSMSMTGGGSAHSMPMAEGPEGTYSATFIGMASGTYQFAVQSTVMEDLFKASATFDIARDQAEQPFPMTQYERGAKVAWEIALYGGVVIALIVITLVALRRAGNSTPGDDEAET